MGHGISRCRCGTAAFSVQLIRRYANKKREKNMRRDRVLPASRSHLGAGPASNPRHRFAGAKLRTPRHRWENSSARRLRVQPSAGRRLHLQSLSDRAKLSAPYRSTGSRLPGRGVAVVAIQPNDPKALAIDELDSSDVGDSLEEKPGAIQASDISLPL